MDDKLPYLALLLPGLILAGYLVYAVFWLERQARRFDHLRGFVPGERVTGLMTNIALFFNFSTPLFSGTWRGIKFDIEESRSRAGVTLSLVCPADTLFCVAFSTGSNSVSPLSGSDFGDMRRMSPGLWAENYAVATDSIPAAAEYLSAESVQQALKVLADAGYRVSVGMSSIKAFCQIDSWGRAPEGGEEKMLRKENLIPALDALCVLAKACPKPARGLAC